MQNSHADREMEVLFRPVWNVKKNYLCGYIIRPAKGGVALNADAMAQRDLALLQKGAEALVRLQEKGEKSVIIVPVGFETLNRYPGRGHYLAMLRRLTEDVRSFIVLQIGDIPLQASRKRLQSVQADVRGLCRALSFQTDVRGVHLDGVSRHNVHACVTDLGLKPADEGDMVGLVTRFADKAQGINCAAMADGVSTRAALLAALSAGYSYIAGAAVQEDQPELGISRRNFAMENALLPAAQAAN